MKEPKECTKSNMGRIKPLDELPVKRHIFYDLTQRKGYTCVICGLHLSWEYVINAWNADINEDYGKFILVEHQRK